MFMKARIHRNFVQHTLPMEAGRGILPFITDSASAFSPLAMSPTYPWQSVPAGHVLNQKISIKYKLITYTGIYIAEERDLSGYTLTQRIDDIDDLLLK